MKEKQNDAVGVGKMRRNMVHVSARALTFAALCRAHGIPLPTAEYRFAPPRRWRFDYAWPRHRVALEVEGGVWVYGRHNRAAGFVRDMEKYNEAAARGWRVVRCLPRDICTEKTLNLIIRCLQPEKRRGLP